MNTKVVRIKEEEKTREMLEKNPGLLEAAEILKNGGLVAFPTETVYGLGANALNEEAAKKIYAAKGRPSDNPLIAHISCMEELPAIVKEIPEAGRKLAEKYWPGPLTMIFPKKDIVPYGTTGGLDTVAVRMPVDPVANCLIHLAGVPIAAPSANTSGRPSPTKAEHVIEDMDGKIEMISFDPHLQPVLTNYPAFIRALKEVGYEGYINYEFCHMPFQGGKVRGYNDYIEDQLRSAQKYVRGLIENA